MIEDLEANFDEGLQILIGESGQELTIGEAYFFGDNGASVVYSGKAKTNLGPETHIFLGEEYNEKKGRGISEYWMNGKVILRNNSIIRKGPLMIGSNWEKETSSHYAHQIKKLNELFGKK